MRSIYPSCSGLSCRRSSRRMRPALWKRAGMRHSWYLVARLCICNKCRVRGKACQKYWQFLLANLYHAPCTCGTHAPHQISGVAASLPTEPVQLLKRAARSCLEPELFAAISVPWHYLTCRLPFWTPVKLLEDWCLLTSAAKVSSPLGSHGVRRKNSFSLNSM